MQSKFIKLVSNIAKLHPENKNYHDTRVAVCEEFIGVLEEMDGEELEPYLHEMKCTVDDGCFTISFKIPLTSYEEMMDLEKRESYRKRDDKKIKELDATVKALDKNLKVHDRLIIITNLSILVHLLRTLF
jgi:hypothetical protein